MIARHWRGWTLVQDAITYENLLRDKVLPELRKIEGYRGGYVTSAGWVGGGRVRRSQFV